MAPDPLAPLLAPEPDADPPTLDELFAKTLAELEVHQPWRQRARCAGREGDFFPPRGRAGATARALELCRECPVRAECLDEALSYEAAIGAVEPVIRGGLEPSERRRRLGPRPGTSGRNPDACRRGHRRQGENLYVDPSSGQRRCRECRREDQRRYNARRRRRDRESA